MTRITWGDPGDKQYETGIDRGVLAVPYNDLVPWNGLVSLTENVAGGEVESYYYDGNKYLDWILYEDFQATLECFSTPREFGVCEGSSEIALGLFVTQQRRQPFNMSWRTLVGDDLTEEAGYIINFMWNCMAAPAEKVSTTKNADNTLATKSLTLYGSYYTPGYVAGTTYKPTAHMKVDTRSGSPYVDEVEAAIYGTDVADPWFPTQQNLLTLFMTGAWT